MSSFVAKEHAKILKRSLLDHCPILLRISNIGWCSIQQRKARRNRQPWCILGDFNSEEVKRGKGKEDLEQVNEIVCALINLWRKWNWKMFLRWVEDSHGVNLTTNQKVD